MTKALIAANRILEAFISQQFTPPYYIGSSDENRIDLDLNLADLEGPDQVIVPSVLITGSLRGEFSILSLVIGPSSLNPFFSKLSNALSTREGDNLEDSGV